MSLVPLFSLPEDHGVADCFFFGPFILSLVLLHSPGLEMSRAKGSSCLIPNFPYSIDEHMIFFLSSQFQGFSREHVEDIAVFGGYYRH